MPVVGLQDKSISNYLKAWIQQGDMCVVGLIGPGTSRQLQANWNSPFEQSSLGSAFEKTAGLFQIVTGQTSKTTLNSTQIWEGNRPLLFNLVLMFYALSDPLQEVMLPLQELEKMASPEANKVSPINVMPGQETFGRMPAPVTLNIGRTTIITDCVIESISTPLDKERNSDGLLIRAETTLTIATKSMLNQSEIAKTWGAA